LHAARLAAGLRGRSSTMWWLRTRRELVKKESRVVSLRVGRRRGSFSYLLKIGLFEEGDRTARMSDPFDETCTWVWY